MMNAIARDEMVSRLRDLLRIGPVAGAAARQSLGISQPTFSRLWKNAGADIVALGGARSTRYAMTRSIGDLGCVFPLYQVDEHGRARPFGELLTLQGNWSAFVPADGTAPLVDIGLPYFLQDLRPQGFMGRMIPAAHADLQLPEKIAEWSDDDCLRYLARRGEDVQGNLIIGNESYRRYLSLRTDTVGAYARKAKYAAFAGQVNQGELPGSSAAGEQPKFTAAILRRDGTTEHVIVKFSAPMSTASGRRWADLLIAEHLALATLRAHGIPACASTILIAGDRAYLEVARFDRVGAHGRLPVVSMTGVDGLLGALEQRWTDSTRLLRDKRQLPVADWETVRLLEVYGALIGNSDRHPGNLSLRWRLPQQFTLAPCYDMLPMLYQPSRQGEVVARHFNIATLDALDLRCLVQAAAMAQAFWQQVTTDVRISAPFREVAARHAAVIAAELTMSPDALQ